MIYLQFSEENVQIQNWRERLDNLIVAYKTECRIELEEPVLREGKKQYSGEGAIEQFLQELEKEVADWRTPRCGV